MYSFAEVDKFPSLEREKSEGSNSIDRGRGSTGGPQKLANLNHNREVIFALPSLQLHLKTEHLQTALLPELQGQQIFFNYNNNKIPFLIYIKNLSKFVKYAKSIMITNQIIKY